MDLNRWSSLSHNPAVGEVFLSQSLNLSRPQPDEERQSHDSLYIETAAQSTDDVLSLFEGVVLRFSGFDCPA